MTATLTASRPIRQLPVELANQIAAGEVVERPASVVKELIENSLDAGATRIEVNISRGGLQRISIRDNGGGIPKQELPLAISRHATSKINSLQELENIQSLGFRGEALASIGSVSRMSLISSTTDSSTAWQIDCDSDALSIQPVSHPPGTSVMVQDLFYNTPARRKFMRAEKTEFRHVDEVVRRMALSHFDVGFSFTHNERQVYQLVPAETELARKRRVAKLCGKAFMEHAVQVDLSVHGLRLWGWVTDRGFSRSQNDLQHFFVNGRIVRDRLISHAIRQVYQEWIHPGRHGAYLLHLEIDPTALDVNVHPTKHEVRFREARLVHDFIHRSLREALSGPSNHSQADRAWTNPWQAPAYEQHDVTASKIAEPSVAMELPLGLAKAFLHKRFIVAENRQGLVLIDARQAQQQLIVQKLNQDLAEGNVQSRPLLIPKTVLISEQQAASVETSQAVLTRFGFDLSLNGPTSVLLRMVPLVLAGADMQALTSRLLDYLSDEKSQYGQKETTASLLPALAEIAAHSQELESSPESLNRLLREAESLNDPSFFREFTEQDMLGLIQQV